MLKYTIETCKCIIGYRVWQYEYNDEWDIQWGAYSFASAGIFICSDKLVIIASHGNDNGNIQSYDQIIDTITDPIYDGYEIVIHCCYPNQVAIAHPELSEYILSKHHKDVTRMINYLNPNNPIPILMTVI
jgi:hypothetical protein